MDFAERADLSLINPGFDRSNVRAVTRRQKVRGDLCLARGLDHHPSFLQPIGQRFVDKHMLAQLHRRHGNRCVQMIGRHDFDRVQILFLRQQFAKISIDRATLEFFRPPLACIRRLNYFPGHFSATRDAWPVLTPARSLECLGDGRT